MGINKVGRFTTVINQLIFSALVSFMISTTSKQTLMGHLFQLEAFTSSLEYQYLSVGRGIKSHSLQ